MEFPKLVGKARFLFEDNGSIRERTIRSGIWISIASGIVRFFEFVRSMVLARILLPELFGIMAIVLFVRGAVDVITSTSFKSALIYRQDDVEAAANTAWTLNILRGAVLFGFLLVVSPAVASFYQEPLLSPAIRFIAFALLIESFGNINTVVFEKELNYQKITIGRIFTSTVSIVTVLALAYIYRSIWALLFGSLLTSCSNMLITYVIQPKRPRLCFDKRLARELFHYGKFVTGTSILVFFTLTAADVVLGKLLSLKELGYYSYAFTLANLPTTHVSAVISEIVFSAYNAIKSDARKLISAFQNIFKLVAIVAIPAGVGIFALAEEIVVYVLGPGWQPAIAPLKVLVVFGVIRSLAATTGPILTAIGKPNVVFWVVLFKFCLITVLLYPLIRLYGTVGAALALTLPIIIEQVVLWYLIRRAFNIGLMPFITTVARIFLISLVMLGAIVVLKRLVPITSVSYIFMNVFAGVVVYGVLIWSLDKESVKEVCGIKR
ncbi:lipopolysaccharide biosynthesis protein [Geomonas paludis]|uniref:Lipopolysaccharide biosynthesis protein n=1 Tax=Geomonas paludis TaxID=2740185 RepID=A0A6V8MWQ5_9BACT|nr:lipopolysaccharide biosynthesis protein [Geomonas paludis]UPU37761.1 lipopolysaccharide biosynthesis protein [Geomonas paludis]GFO63699.1 lipopolysaccharide biosynthesis protein [Geomonas paludis]